VVEAKITDLVIPSVTDIERRVHRIGTTRVPKTRSSPLCPAVRERDAHDYTSRSTALQRCGP
jgi:hypothetical protein